MRGGHLPRPSRSAKRRLHSVPAAAQDPWRSPAPLGSPKRERLIISSPLTTFKVVLSIPPARNPPHHRSPGRIARGRGVPCQRWCFTSSLFPLPLLLSHVIVHRILGYLPPQPSTTTPTYLIPPGTEFTPFPPLSPSRVGQPVSPASAIRAKG